jgi:hypothetical protein
MSSKVRSRALAGSVALLAIAFVVLQFIRPTLSDPPVTAEIDAPPEVKAILRNSCYNCHSNETKLSWFDQLVPAYWLVVKDVNSARHHLNFSEIGRLPLAQQKAALYEAVLQISLGAMPVPSYKKLHPDSAVTPPQFAVLKQYLAPKANEPSTTAQIEAADAEYQKWIESGNAAQTVLPAPNGIAFLPDYKNWKAISTTDRFDNHSLRVILGNDVAIGAIAENHINPWPDGSTFAKVAWLQQTDKNGFVRTGQFFQVEFMIRDSKKYARTLGWGWARWRGAGLKPYGENANFTRECVGCHAPLRDTDFVFTEPIRGQR